MDSVVPVDGDLKIENFSLSPDGSVVAFQFIGWKNGPHANTREGIGLYDWRTGRLERIKNPPRKLLQSPSFSPDGKQITVVVIDSEHTGRITSNIAVLELATGVITEVTPPNYGLGRHSPVFQPGTDNIVYTVESSTTRAGLMSVDVSRRSEKMLVDPMIGFRYIYRPMFATIDSMYFQGVGPYGELLKSRIKELGLEQGGSTVTYRLRLGDTPEVAFPNVEIALHGKIDNSGMQFFSVSKGANVMVFNKNVVPDTSSHYEMGIFEMDKNTESIIRLTNSIGILAYTTISYDGSTVAFGREQVMQRVFDIYVLDIKTRNVFQTDLRAKINADQRFYAD